MTDDLKHYAEQLKHYLDIKHPYSTLLGEDASDDLSRFDYVVDLTNGYIADDDFNPDELNDLMNQVSVKISETHILTKDQLEQFISLVKSDTYEYEGSKLNYIEN